MAANVFKPVFKPSAEVETDRQDEKEASQKSIK